MATVRSHNGKLYVPSDTSLNYLDKENTQKEKQLKTVATEVIKQAASVASMDVGNVRVSFKNEAGEYKNYFVNRRPDGSAIVLRPTETKDQKDTFIYFNKEIKKDKDGNAIQTPNGQDAFYYQLNNKSQAGKDFENSLSYSTFQSRDGIEQKSLNATIFLKNDEMAKKISELGDEGMAVLSKDGYRITTITEHFKGKNKEEDRGYKQTTQEKSKESLER